jgi:hypothetical protein
MIGCPWFARNLEFALADGDAALNLPVTFMQVPAAEEMLRGLSTILSLAAIRRQRKHGL